MGNQSQSVILKLTGAIVIDGNIVKAGTMVELTQPEAKDLLRRGKAVLATEKNAAPMTVNEGTEDEGEVDLSKLNKAELVDIATANGMEHAEKLNKSDLIAAIQAKQAADAADE